MAYSDGDIIRDFSGIPVDSPVPPVGACGIFHESFIDRESAILLDGGDVFHVFYFNSYDTIEEIGGAPPGFYFERKGDKILCLVIFNPGENQVTCYLPLDTREEKHVAFLRRIGENGVLKMHFITMLYGVLHKMKSLDLSVPSSALEDLHL